MRIDAKKIKKQIYQKFGWHLSFWAKKRGFTKWQVYDFLRGKAGERTKKHILEMLQKDGVI